jgi:hypothetical protein
MPPTSDIQFLAQMVVASREGHQINSADAQRLNNLATFGDSAPRGGDVFGRTTMPEERRDASKPLTPGGASDLVTG